MWQKNKGKKRNDTLFRKYILFREEYVIGKSGIKQKGKSDYEWI